MEPISVARRRLGRAAALVAALLASVSAAVLVAPGSAQAGPATAIRIVTSPATTLAGRPLAHTLTVKVVDAGGATVAPSAPLTVTIASGPAGATLQGTTGLAAPTGQVAFTGLTLQVAGTYTLRISSTGLPSITTAAIAVISQRIGVPSYFYPGTNWTSTIAAQPTVGFAIANPANGPGTIADANYTNQIAAAHAKGLAVLGYVYSDYGTRSLATVKADIAHFYALYPIDGIFIDLTPSACTLVSSYYTPLYQYAKSFGASAGHTNLVVINPGTQVPECFTAASDVIVNFEGYYADYVAGYTQPLWVSRYDPRRFWHIVHDVTTAAEADHAVRLSQTRRAGWVYVTDEKQTPVPPDVYTYDRLPKPAFWAAEILAVTRRPSTAPTAVGATAGTGQATVHWTAPAGNLGAPVSGYVVVPYVGTTKLAARSFSGTATTRTVTGLTPGTSVTFRVAATNANGVGPYSAASTAVTIG